MHEEFLDWDVYMYHGKSPSHHTLLCSLDPAQQHPKAVQLFWGTTDFGSTRVIVGYMGMSGFCHTRSISSIVSIIFLDPIHSTTDCRVMVGSGCVVICRILSWMMEISFVVHSYYGISLVLKGTGFYEAGTWTVCTRYFSPML